MMLSYLDGAILMSPRHHPLPIRLNMPDENLEDEEMDIDEDSIGEEVLLE